MKMKYLLSAAVLTLMTPIALAGFVQTVPVMVDFDNRIAHGDQLTARVSPNDVESVGCASRAIADGINPLFEFAFCDATDSAGVHITCFTFDADLVHAVRAASAYAYIQFGWNENEECTRIGFSTRSIYLPDPSLKSKEK